MRENWLLAGSAFAEIISVHHMHFHSFFCAPPVTRSSVPFSRPFLTSYVPCFMSLPCLPSSVPCPLSHFSVPCFLSCSLSYGSVPCRSSSVQRLMSLSFVSRPLSPVSRLYSLSPVLCIPCLTWSVPCLPSSFLPRINCPSVPFYVALFHCSCPFVPLFRLPSSVPCLSCLREFCEFFLGKIHGYTWNRRFRWLICLAVG
jgi:hypothetical protein